MNVALYFRFVATGIWAGTAVDPVHRVRDALRDKQVEAGEKLGHLLLEDGVLFGSEFGEHVVLEIDLRRMPRADADSKTTKAVADVIEQTGQAVVSAVAAGDREFGATDRQLELVEDDDDFLRLDAMVTTEGADCAPAIVHERERLQHV